MHVLFMGTPAFALPALRVLANQYGLQAVVTAPDRPAGRGRVLTQPPAKQLAIELGVRVLQPTRLRGEEVVSQLKAMEPDLVVVAAYGQILPQEVLSLPRFGCLNLHASLLPRHRGASPISAAILAGDATTGVTLMKMDAGLDTGPILAQKKVEILPEEDAGSLGQRLAQVAAAMVLQELPRYLGGELGATEQDPNLATYAAPLRSADGKLDFDDSALALERRVRAMNPWPGAHCRWAQRRLRVVKAKAITSAEADLRAEPGTVLGTPVGPAVKTGKDDLLLVQVQLPGRRVLSGADFVRGARGFVGSRLQ